MSRVSLADRLVWVWVAVCWGLVLPDLAAADSLAAGRLASRRAEEALRAQEWQLAESHYREVLLEVYLQRGWSLAAAGELELAAVALERATRSALPLRRPLLALAQVEMRRGRVLTVLPDLRRLAAQYPADGEVRRVLAQALVAAGLAEEALQELREMVVAHPADLESSFALATAYLSLGRIAEGATQLDHLLAAKASTGPAATLVLVGRTWRDYGEFGRARQALQQALALDPGLRRAHFYLGTVELLAEGKNGIDAALDHFDAELAQTPGDPWVHLYRGLALVEQRRFAEAKPSLEIASKVPSLAADALHFLGRCQSETDEDPAAIASFRRALVLLDPESADPQQLTSLHVQLGHALRRQGQEEAAVDHYEAARQYSLRYTENSRERLSQYLGDLSRQEGMPIWSSLALELPEKADAATWQAELREGLTLLARAHQNLGILAIRRGNKERGMRELQEASHLVPEAPGLDRALGITALGLGRQSLALPHLERALRQNPGDAEVGRLLALVWLELGEWQRAANWLATDPALEQDPALRYALALALVRSGQAAAAEAQFAILEKSHANWAPYAVLLGQAEAQQGDFAAAERHLARALTLDPQVAQAHATRGEMWLRQGRLAEAITELRAELLHHPDSQLARFQLATALDLSQQPAEARRELAILLAKEPEHGGALYLLGKILLAQGEPRPAAERLAAAATLFPEDVNIRYQWAMALQRSGRGGEAATQFGIYRELKAKEREVEP